MFILENYLKKTLPNFVSHPANNKFWVRYNLKRLQRFTIHFLIIFFCQWVTIGFSSFSAPISPLYAPMGSAFVMMYWFGRSSVAALMCAGISAYLLQGLTWPFLVSYLTADILPGVIAIILWQDMFLSENPNLDQCRAWLRFIVLNSGFTCFLSAVFRMLPIFFMGENLSAQKCSYHFITLWLADINGLLVLFAFAINWLYLAYSRAVIVPKTELKKAYFWILCACLGMVILFFKSSVFYYGIFLSMVLSVYLAYQSGLIFGSLLMYCIALLYFAYFTIHKTELVLHYGFKFYTLVSIILFLYNIILISSANIGRKRCA